MSTTQLAAAAQDEVSAAIAGVFGSHAQQFQALIARAGLFHDEFTANLRAAADSYVIQDASAHLASWERALENLPGLPSQVAGTVATASASVQQDVLHAAGFLPIPPGQVLNNIASWIIGSPASPAIPASQHPVYTGTPSIGARIELRGLDAVKTIGQFFGIPNVYAELGPAISSTSPPKFLTLLFGETVQHTTYDGMSVVQITPAHPSGKYVIAVHGGAWVLQPSIENWLFYTQMANATGATIEVPLYALETAPNGAGTAAVVVPEIAGFISSQIAAHGVSNVSLTGDSAGGSISLSAVQLLVSEGLAVPSSMVLMSPGLDASFSNPNMSLINDPILSVDQVKGYGLAWAGNLPLTDPLVSPIYGSLQGLPPTYVYSGSVDILSTDTLNLVQKAAVDGAPISFVLRTGEVHDWALSSPDSTRYNEQIYQELGI